MNWEPVTEKTYVECRCHYTERLAVPGGWLYRSVILPQHEKESPTVAMVFVPAYYKIPEVKEGE